MIKRIIMEIKTDNEDYITQFESGQEMLILGLQAMAGEYSDVEIVIKIEDV